MKLKDFLREIAEKGGIRDNDFEAALGASALAEVEIADSFKDKFNQAYLTLDRAKNDPEIIKGVQKEIRAEIFNKVDERLKPLYDYADDETKDILGKTFETYKRLEMLPEAIGKGLKSKQTQKNGEDVRKVEDEWSNKLKQATTTHQEELGRLKQQFKDEKINFAIKQELGKFKISESFSGVWPQISDSIINKVRGYSHNGAKTEVDFDENGALHIRQNVDGSLRDIFDSGNNKLGLESLLQKEVEPFTVKSNGSANAAAANNGNNGSANNGAGGANNGQKKPTGPGLTLHEEMWARAATA